MLEFEHGIVKRFGWSLREMDETDMESLIPFVFYKPGGGGGGGKVKKKRVYCDQVGWM